MKGVVCTGNKTVDVREFPKPVPGPGEVVVRMKISGLCGSDLLFYRQSRAEREASPVISGHEPCGIVDSIGSAVSGVREGDRVAVYHYRGCGFCRYCLAGNLMCCDQRRGYGWHVDGSHADYILTDARNCMILPDELSFIDGAMIACGTGTAYSALRKLGISGQHTLAIFGQGPVGLSGLLIAKAMGARVICVQPGQQRGELSVQLGADELIDPTSTDPVEAIRDLTAGHGADCAMECSGAPAAQHAVLECLGFMGKAVILGAGPKEKSINLSQLLSNQLTIMGSFVMPLPMYHDLKKFMVDHKISLERMITHRYPIDQAPEAFELFGSGQTGKVVFIWN